MTYTLAQFCDDKRLPLDWAVKTFGLRDGEDTLHHKEDDPTGRWKKGDTFTVKGIFFPYSDAEENRQHRIRHSKEGKKRFCWGSDYKQQMLYGLNVPRPEGNDGKTVVIVEGESCTITGRLCGLYTIGIAGAPYGWEDHFKNLPQFAAAERIFVIQEKKRADLKPEDIDAGAELVKRVAASFPGKVSSIRLDEIAKVKDLSDLWLHCCELNPIAPEDEFGPLWEKAKASAIEPGMEWRRSFRAGCELEQGEMRQIIPGILVEGVNLTGACSGVGKTWFQVSQARAVCTGEPFLGNFRVPERLKVLYLIPEAGHRGFRKRLEKMHLPLDGSVFLCRTMKEGILRLDDPALEGAIKAGYRGIYLDTAIRFADGADENSSTQNANGLAEGIFNLLRWGALFVVGAQHSRKSFADLNKAGTDYAEESTLENALRGTGDMGAMCDSVWAIRHASDGETTGYIEESRNLTRIRVQNVKARDFEAADPFVIQGKPHIDETGDFKVLVGDYAPVASPYERAAALIAAEQKISVNALTNKLGISRRHFKRDAVPGWAWKETSKTTGFWVPKQAAEEKMPFAENQ